MRPEEIRAARYALGLSVREMARVIGLSEANGNDRVMDWEEGRLAISGPASQCIRLWLAVNDLGPVPEMKQKILARK